VLVLYVWFISTLNKRGYEEIRDRKLLEILKKDRTWLKYELHCNGKTPAPLFLQNNLTFVIQMLTLGFKWIKKSHKILCSHIFIIHNEHTYITGDYNNLCLNIICNRSFFLFWNDVSFVPVRVLHKNEKILGRKHIYILFLFNYICIDLLKL
jgi:hypothetical protein